jgi:hypothetical protein
MIRFIAFVVLIIHVNISMFIPVIDERDQFDVHGRQVGDVNSAVDFINQVILGNEDNSGQDHDDDQAHFFNIHNIKYCIVEQRISIPANIDTDESSVKKFPVNSEDNYPSLAYDIISPPPEA